MDNNDRILTQEDSDSIDLLPIIRVWLNRWWQIAIVMLIFGAVAVAVTKVAIPPKYTSSFTAYVNNRIMDKEGQTSLSSSDLSASRSLAYTYSVIAESYAVLEEAGQRAHLTETVTQLSGMVTPAIMDDTEIISVLVETNSPQKSKVLAEALADILTETGPEIVEGSSLKLIDMPRLPASPSSPNTMKNAVIAMLAGAVIMIGFLTLMTIFNTTLKSETALEENFGLPILGTIPRQEDAEKESSQYSYGYGYGYGSKKSGGVKNG